MAALRHKLALAVSEVRGPEAAEPLLRESLRRHRELLPPRSRDVGIAEGNFDYVVVEFHKTMGSRPRSASGEAAVAMLSPTALKWLR